mmetsp:Transcript_61174/g.169614  ORF Transcript_61174/g.169614 Transcript_61174/m.169614 type:complete len:220 (+) Transcript_61174:52-711(+)
MAESKERKPRRRNSAPARFEHDAAWSECAAWPRSPKDQWERKSERWAREKHRSSTAGLFNSYATTNPNRLNHAEVTELLTDLNYGKPVHSDVVRYMMAKVSSRSDESTVDIDQMQTLITNFKKSAQRSRELEPMMQKYDEDNKGHLTKAEVATMLMELNEGRPVEEYVVEWVFEESDILDNGVITLFELPRVVTFWECRKSMRGRSKEPRAARKSCAVQ